MPSFFDFLQVIRFHFLLLPCIWTKILDTPLANGVYSFHHASESREVLCTRRINSRSQALSRGRKDSKIREFTNSIGEGSSFGFNKLVIHPRFQATIEEISKMDVKLPNIDTYHSIYSDSDPLYQTGELVTPIDDVGKVALIAATGWDFAVNQANVIAYDESFIKFNCLEGVAFFTSHAIVLMDKNEYLPSTYLTFHFFTRSKEIVSRSKYIDFSDDPETSFQKAYIRDRISFLSNTAPSKSILLIDGPLIGGDVYTILIASISEFTKRDIVPVFFVKNSASNLVTDNLVELRHMYNSDMHWSYCFLDKGERTNFFVYRDRNNPDNAKVFCYIKSSSSSPQRVEFHVETFSKYRAIIPDILNMVYYFLLVQGDMKNTQVRPIIIAEKFAKETLKLININKLMREVGIVPTMNQARFGG